MTTHKHGVLLSSFLIVLILSLGSSAWADNRAFLSTNLESSQASYVLDFTPNTTGAVDKFRLAFPAGTLAGGVELRDLLIDGKAARPPILTSIDQTDPNALFVDVRLTAVIRAGAPVVLELIGITNPPAGDYNIGIKLLGKLNNQIDALSIPFSIEPRAAGPGGGGGGWADDGTTVRLVTGTDNVGIGTTSPQSKFHIVSGGSALVPPRVESSAANGFASGWDFYLGSTAKGYVGTPGSTAFFGPGELILFGGTSTKTSLWADHLRGLTVDTNAHVGVGTASPFALLDVEGSSGPHLRLNHTGPSGGPSLWLTQDGSLGGSIFWDPAAGTLNLQTGLISPTLTIFAANGESQFGGNVILSAGRALFLGNSPPGLANPVGACVDANDVRNKLSRCSSSLRYKDNPRSFVGGLDIVNRLRAISFTWKGEGGAVDIGLAAEEVADVEPLLTFRNEQGEIEGVKYNQLSAVFVNAFKDQQAQIDEQRSLYLRQQEELQVQQRENRELRARLESLERLVNAQTHRTVSLEPSQ